MHPLLPIAQRAAQMASDAIIPFYGSDLFELKADNSPVTKADTAAHERILEVLGETGIPILSEEDTLRTPLPYPERIWIIDPLDGTKGFINHTDDFSVMIALLEHGRPVVAVVHAPILGKQYYATRGGGAFVVEEAGERKLHVSTRLVPDLIGMVSVNHKAPYMAGVCTRLSVSDTKAIGSVGIKAGFIAEGLADFYPNRGFLGEWDVCAPELILTEAGGIVTDTLGNLLSYGSEDHRITQGIVFSNGICHTLVLDALQSEPT
jgi:3'(2'), 5'-bisphosphate nucleotidase